MPLGIRSSFSYKSSGSSSSNGGSSFLRRMLHESEARDKGRYPVPTAFEKRIKWMEEQRAMNQQALSPEQNGANGFAAAQQAPSVAQNAASINHRAAYTAICMRLENLGVYEMPENVRSELDKIVCEIREVMRYC